MRMKIPAANGGNPYTVSTDGRNYYLHRLSQKGIDSTVTMTRADVINVCNALIDAAEAKP